MRRPGTPEDALEATSRFYQDRGFAYSLDYVTGWLREHVALPSSGRVLDLCCGDGIWSLGMKVLEPQLTLFGIDIAAGGITKARELVGPEEHFVVGDAERALPWPEGYFDVIFARGPGLFNQHDMTHPGAIAVLSRWHSHLTPRGRFYSIFASRPDTMGSYTPLTDVVLPYNQVPRTTDSVIFSGGKFHHSIESFHAPFSACPDVDVVSYRFVSNTHILVSRASDLPTKDAPLGIT